MSNDSKLYSQKECQIMEVFNELPDMSCNRIELIRDLALGTNCKTIGLANCVMFGRETKAIERFLSKDFIVHSVNCKYGRLQEGELIKGGSARVICNPAGQADFLNAQGSDLNISIGLCVGHDMIFSQHSQAPVTTLFTKDFTNDNDPAEAVASLN